MKYENILETCTKLCTGPLHAKGCPVLKVLRDTYCTPPWLTYLLPEFDLDPCSNPRSTVKAHRQLMREKGHDGLAYPWKGLSVYCNPPFSNPLPWAQKCAETSCFVFMCATDHTTKWFQTLVENGGVYEFRINTRVAFEPPPRVQQSTNNRPSSLICSRKGRELLDRAVSDVFYDHGAWWQLS